MNGTKYPISLIVGGPHDGAWIEIAEGAPTIRIPVLLIHTSSMAIGPRTATGPDYDHLALYVRDSRLRAVNDAPVFRFAGPEPTEDATKLAVSLYDQCAHLYRDDRAWINFVAGAITAIRGGTGTPERV